MRHSGPQDRSKAPRISLGTDPMQAAYREAVQLRSSPYVGSGKLRASKPTTTWSGLEVLLVRKVRDSGRAWPLFSTLVLKAHAGPYAREVFTYHIRIKG